MALSGDIWGKWDGNHNAWSHERLDSKLTWSATQNVANNTSTITAVLHYYCAADLAPQVSTNWANTAFRITIDGQAVNATGIQFNVVGKTYFQIMTASKTISHNSDGTKTFNISAIATIAPGTWLGGPSGLSKSFTLNTIPRASTLSSFSMGAQLQTSTANSVNLGLSRASTSFTHDIWLYYGSNLIASWSGQGVPSSLPVTAAQVNVLLSKMSNVTTGTMTLKVQTKSGSTNIGSQLSRTATATINANVMPTATHPTAVIYGSDRDKTIGKFVQNISRVTSSFTASAGYGATLTSTSIIIRRKSDNGNAQTISGTSGTIASAVNLSGTYQAITYVKDSRGRTATAKGIDFTVHAYSTPRINAFTAARTVPSTTINYSRNGTWSALGGDNPVTIKVQYRERGGSWITAESVNDDFGSFAAARQITGLSDIKSYDLQLTVTDSFGKSSSSMVSVSTQRVVMDIHKDEGVGIGKVHEQGALDVGGKIYIDGLVVPKDLTLYNYANGVLIDLIPATSTGRMLTIIVTGNGYSATNTPIMTLIQGYHYTPSGNFINCAQINLGDASIGTAKFFLDGGRVKCWFSQGGEFKTLSIRVLETGRYINNFTVTNTAEPTGTNKVNCALKYDVAAHMSESATDAHTWQNIAGKPTLPERTHYNAWIPAGATHNFGSLTTGVYLLMTSRTSAGGSLWVVIASSGVPAAERLSKIYGAGQVGTPSFSGWEFRFEAIVHGGETVALYRYK